MQLISSPLEFFRTVANHSGALAEIRLGGRRFYVLNDPELIRDIFVARGAQFEKFPQGNPKQKLFGNGLLTSEGQLKRCSAVFSYPLFIEIA